MMNEAGTVRNFGSPIVRTSLSKIMVAPRVFGVGNKPCWIWGKALKP